MKVMLLAAGLGTRLKPLTDVTPKPLIPVNEVPLIFYALALLKKHGLTDVVINLHHLGDQIEKALGSGEKWGFNFQYSWEPEILGTGGGIKKAHPLLKNDGPFLVFNADIIIDLNLDALIRFHQKNSPLATLVVKESTEADSFGALGIDNQGHLRSILTPVAPGLKKTFFTGVHVIENEVIDRLPDNQKSCIIRQGYIPFLQEGRPFGAYLHDGSWNDLGTPERLKETEADLKSRKLALSYDQEIKEMKAQFKSNS